MSAGFELGWSNYKVRTLTTKPRQNPNLISMVYVSLFLSQLNKSLNKMFGQNNFSNWPQCVQQTIAAYDA